MSFGLRINMLNISHMTTWCIYWTFQSMMLRTLQTAFGLYHSQAIQITIAIPMVSCGVIFVTMCLSKLTGNQSSFLFVASVICATTMLLIPLVNSQSLTMAWVIAMLHAVYGGIYGSTFFACVISSVS